MWWTQKYRRRIAELEQETKDLARVNRILSSQVESYKRTISTLMARTDKLEPLRCRVCGRFTKETHTYHPGTL